MKISYRGVTTVFLAWVMLFFLMLCLVLAEGIRMYFIRAKAEQAAELADFSALSEYHPALFEKYDLLFLDLDYGHSRERTEVLHARIGQYLAENAGEAATQGLAVKKFVRATDGGGSPFFKQAVASVKFRSGIGAAEKLIADVFINENENDLRQQIERKESEAGGLLSGLTDEDGEPLFDISLPHISFPDMGILAGRVFGEETVLSDKSFSAQERIGKRRVQKGAGTECEKSFPDMQLFHSYVLGHCAYYGSAGENTGKEALEYQVEYIIAGEENDRENLKNIMWRIFLIQSAGNYARYHQDASKMAQAGAKAAAVAGITGNAALVEAVKELFLLADAVEEGIDETKEIFHGGRVPLIQNGAFSGLEIDYRGYLQLFLQLTGKEDKILRCMDVIEMEVRKFPECENFRFDHCTDRFEMEWTYRFKSLFMEIPVLDGVIYQNKIRRKIYYEV